MKLGYYPGCSMHGTSREHEESLLAIAKPLGLELAEIEDWSCCGACSAHACNRTLAVALPARNLALAEEQGHDRVIAPCAACYNRLAMATHEVASDPQMAGRVRAVLSRPFANRVKVLNAVEVLRELVPTLKTNVKRPLTGLKVGCYYGCLLLRPAEVTGFDDPEDPSSMEEVVRACGAEPVSWRMRVECCGAGLTMARKPSVVRLGRAIISDAMASGADVIVVSCPMCHSNLDFRQQAMGLSRPMPVVYLTQLVGLALGLDSSALGLARHFVSTGGVVPRNAAQEVG